MRRKPSHLSLAPPLASTPSEPLPANLVRLLFQQAGGLVEADDPIQAELWCSDVLGAVWAATDGDPAAEETFVDAWIAAAEADGDATAAVTALTALSMIAGSGSARRSAAAAAERLVGRAAPRPRWAAAADQISSGECWHYGDVFGDQETILCAFRRGAREHAMLVLIDYTLGGIAKDVFFTEAVAGSLADLQYELGSTPIAFLEPIEPEVARRRLQRAFRVTDSRVEPRVNDEFAPHRALALARVRTLPPSIEASEPGPVVHPDAVIEEFLSSSYAADLPDFELAGDWARILVERALSADDDPARVGPGVLDEVLLVEVPEHAVLDAPARNAMPAVLTAWTLWAGHRQGLAEPAVAWLRTVLDEILEEFPEAYRDPSAVAHRNTCPDTVGVRADRPTPFVHRSPDDTVLPLRTEPISPTVLRATSAASRVGRARPK